MLVGSRIVWGLVSAIAVGLIVALIILTYFRMLKRKGANADPLVEAGFYYAYGQRKRAIDILEKALLVHPEREDLANRLAEWRNG